MPGVVGLVLGLALAATGAHAREAGEWHHTHRIQGRSNTPGIGLWFDHALRVRPHHRPGDPEPPHPLLAGTYVEAGVTAQVSPANFHPGVYAQAVPVAPLRLRVSVQRAMWFGWISALNEYEGTEPDWSREELRRRLWDARPDTAIFATAQAVLQLKLGPVLALHDHTFTYVHAASVEPGNSWHEPQSDLLVARGDLIHAMKTTTAWSFGDVRARFWALGVHWERWTTRNTAVKRDIVGPLILARPWPESFGRPLFAVLTGAMADDPYRTGTHYIGFQITFEVDLADEDGR